MSNASRLYDTLSFRTLEEADRAAVDRIAALDSRATPPAPWLVAVVDGRPVAARSLRTGETVADPFEPTAALLPLLALRARHLRAPGAERSAMRAVRARLRPS